MEFSSQVRQQSNEEFSSIAEMKIKQINIATEADGSSANDPSVPNSKLHFLIGKMKELSIFFSEATSAHTGKRIDFNSVAR